MHQSAFNHMQNCINSNLARNKHYDIIEVGSRMVDGQKLSHREILQNFDHSYTGLDVEAGPNVDVVLVQPYSIPIKTSSADVIVCGQVFEHVPFFWVSFLEMARMLRQNGYIFLSVPSRGHVHASKQEFDCWRFYPDSMRALAAFAGLSLIDVHTDFPPKIPGSRAYDYTRVAEDRYWGDTVAVFRREAPLTIKQRVFTAALTWWSNRQAPNLAELIEQRIRTGK
ncbi:Methyltransferase domain protein [Labrenzia sp. THAF191b]|uniref:methyltransferase domain-containing protein n=1 Tax=unclassified Labrenzia TaxID=2648686 RepID=UPI001268F18C|nr:MULTISPECIES: methyltransferase domain-containing protein [unclassified Labrenzia]QFS98895.1 Methyltransferase domain protein [Labrenzia sp. THAF191b]QFT05209.1 Methyltransferase domain protein [Labrenzia sp. THAF191a]QFT16753.1 Methyltransferase domain protein [Labrenzia sp. THAF187b]